MRAGGMYHLFQECVQGGRCGSPDPAKTEVRIGHEGEGGVGHEKLLIPILSEERSF